MFDVSYIYNIHIKYMSICIVIYIIGIYDLHSIFTLCCFQLQVDLSSLRRPFKAKDRVSVQVDQARGMTPSRAAAYGDLRNVKQTISFPNFGSFRIWRAESIYEDLEAPVSEHRINPQTFPDVS